VDGAARGLTGRGGPANICGNFWDGRHMRSPFLRNLSLLAAASLLAPACSTAKKEVKKDTVHEEDNIEGVKESKSGNEIVKEFDLNHDGKTDVWKFYQKDAQGQLKLVRKEMDINWDGRVDVFKYYDDKEQMTKEALDLDYDGHLDQVTYFKSGEIEHKEKDLDYNGKPDLWVFFEKGQIVRKERDTKGAGKVDYWEIWANGAPSRVGEDLDGDGSVDRWTSLTDNGSSSK
jgi:antitoxin component YwqK of YwqJK toxin-antitoxin module